MCLIYTYRMPISPTDVNNEGSLPEHQKDGFWHSQEVMKLSRDEFLIRRVVECSEQWDQSFDTGCSQLLCMARKRPTYPMASTKINCTQNFHVSSVEAILSRYFLNCTKKKNWFHLTA